MKRFLMSLFFVLVFLAGAYSNVYSAVITTYNCWELTGGGTRALDSISVSDTQDNDRAFILTSANEFYYFEFQSAATDAENTSTHPYRVRPDDYATQGVWYEQTLVPYFQSDVLIGLTNEYKIGGYRALATPVDHTNIVVGRGGSSLTTGVGHVLIGNGAGDVLTTETYIVALGYQSFFNLSGATRDVAIGYQSGYSLTSGSDSLYIGHQTGYHNVSGNYVTAIGGQAGLGVSGNSYDNVVLIGYRSGYGLTTGGGHVLIGSRTGESLSSQSNDTIIGYLAGTNFEADGSVLIGYQSGYSATTAEDTTSIGWRSSWQLTTGIRNTTGGYEASFYNKTGTMNSIWGYQAARGASNQSHSYNSIYGARAAYDITVAQNILAAGHKAAENLTSGSYGVYLGAFAGDNVTTAQNCIVIGYNVDAPVDGTTNNQMNIGNTIYGDIGNYYVGIGKYPTAPLEIDLSTEDYQIVDAGSAGATEQDWIEVTVGGNTGYIRVFAAK